VFIKHNKIWLYIALLELGLCALLLQINDSDSHSVLMEQSLCIWEWLPGNQSMCETTWKQLSSDFCFHLLHESRFFKEEHAERVRTQMKMPCVTMKKCFFLNSLCFKLNEIKEVVLNEIMNKAV